MTAHAFSASVELTKSLVDMVPGLADKVKETSPGSGKYPPAWGCANGCEYVKIFGCSFWVDFTAKIIASVGAAFLLAGIPLYHSVLDSLLIFGAIQAGADFGYLDWLAWFWYTLLLNVIGGVLLVTALRLLRTKPLVEKRRAQAPEDPDEPHGDR